MRRPTRVKIIVALLVATGLATTLAVASTTRQTSQARSGIEHIWVSDFNLNSVNTPTAIVASGLFTDAGKLVGKGPKDKGAIFDIDLSKGTILANKWHKAHPRYSLNPSTCLVTLNTTGYISLQRGTGAYKGISGNISIGGDVYAVVPRLQSGKCNASQNAMPIGVVGMYSGSGKITISR
jgi:hypothetical protein